MRRLQATNSRMLPHPAGRIWTVLTDLDNYAAWWPSFIRIRTLHREKGLIGTRIAIRPFGGQAFHCEVAEWVEGQALTFRYARLYTGTGTWSVAEHDGQSRVTYRIDLTIQNRLIRLLSFVLPVAAIHERLMDEVLAGLARRLEVPDGPPPAA